MNLNISVKDLLNLPLDDIIHIQNYADVNMYTLVSWSLNKDQDGIYLYGEYNNGRTVTTSNIVKMNAHRRYLLFQTQSGNIYKCLL